MDIVFKNATDYIRKKKSFNKKELEYLKDRKDYLNGLKLYDMNNLAINYTIDESYKNL